MCGFEQARRHPWRVPSPPEAQLGKRTSGRRRQEILTEVIKSRVR